MQTGTSHIHITNPIYTLVIPHYLEEPHVIDCQDDTEGVHRGLEKLMIDAERDSSRSPQPVIGYKTYVKPAKDPSRKKEVFM